MPIVTIHLRKSPAIDKSLPIDYTQPIATHNSQDDIEDEDRLLRKHARKDYKSKQKKTARLTGSVPELLLLPPPTGAAASSPQQAIVSSQPSAQAPSSMMQVRRVNPEMIKNGSSIYLTDR